MWYHASFFFDYVGWLNEINLILQEIDKGNYSTLRSQVGKILNQQDKKGLLLEFGCGPTDLISETKTALNSPYTNSIIGKWLFITIFGFYFPVENHLGLDWRITSKCLQSLGWEREDVGELMNGVPLGKLLNKEMVPDKIQEHSDPYWYWIRPLYSFNQGGCLSTEKIQYFLEKLMRFQTNPVSADFFKSIMLPEDQFVLWKTSFEKGILNLSSIFKTALIKRVGLYSAIVHEWDD